MKYLMAIFLYLCFSDMAFALVDNNATDETKDLYTQLQNAQGNYIYYGQADPFRFSSVLPQSDCYAITGKQPYFAEFCFTWFLNELNNTTLDYKGKMQKHYRNGGIVGLSWWPTNPVTINGYRDETGDPVTNALPGGTARSFYLSMLDKIATFLNNLKDDNGNLIPVIFRTFVENDGTWFWWGRDTCTEAQFVSLWQDMVVYLRDTKGVHNILYCYNPEVINTYDYDGLLYPGDNYVDICGVDRYSDNGITASVLASYQAASDVALEKDKVYMITEGFRNLEDYPLETAWTDWFNAILNDSKTKRAVIVTPHRGGVIGQKWGPFYGRSDAASFLEMSQNPKIKFLQYKQWIYNATIRNGTLN